MPYNDSVLLLILKILVAIIALVLLVGFVRSWQVEHSPRAQQFLNGTVPNPLPDGLYAGSVAGLTTSWKGKRFDAASSMGVNIFDAGNAAFERYPFQTSVGAGVRVGGEQVLRIDYNIPQNPPWLHPILDEVVEVAPRQLLGKLQLRIIPGYPFMLGFFELKK